VCWGLNLLTNHVLTSQNAQKMCAMATTGTQSSGSAVNSLLAIAAAKYAKFNSVDPGADVGAPQNRLVSSL
jgi:hypothetical protein